MVIISAMGATSFIVFAMPKTVSAQTKHVIGGHLVGLASGAILREIGTTNRTVLSDYFKHISRNTGLIMKVHQSNFKMIGFVKRPSITELVKLGKKHKLCVVEDLGSGVLLRTEDFELAHEPTIFEALSAGADLVCFSGDKLLGAPQAGIILGKKKYIDILKKHPLHRALRLDKMFLAGLEKVLFRIFEVLGCEY